MSKISKVDVLAAVESALSIAPGTLDINARAEDVEGWDSIGQLSILVALDRLFDGKIANISEIALAYSLQDIFEVLENNALI